MHHWFFLKNETYYVPLSLDTNLHEYIRMLLENEKETGILFDKNVAINNSKNVAVLTAGSWSGIRSIAQHGRQ